VLFPVAIVPKPKAYGWQRARGHATDYNDILERRRAQLRKADLAAVPALLEEWYELIKELDAVLRYGFKSQIEPPPPNDDGRRKRVSAHPLFFSSCSSIPTTTSFTTTASQ
jgi:hypothetical protein